MRISDWSSDVCSSDLEQRHFTEDRRDKIKLEQPNQAPIETSDDKKDQRNDVESTHFLLPFFNRLTSTDSSCWVSLVGPCRPLNLTIERLFILQKPATAADRKSTRLNSSH